MEPFYEEIWVESPKGPLMCALINGDRGWLMYLREKGDSGFSSRNPNYEGPPDAMIEYCLNNGQLDEYPAFWALPISEIWRAIEYFQEKHQQPPFVVWHED